MSFLVRIASASARLLIQHSPRSGRLSDAPASPPSSRSEQALSFAGYWGFNTALVVSVALLFGFLAIGSNATWLSWLKLALGVTIATEGFLLARDWRGARRLVLWQIHQRRETRIEGRVPLPRLLLRRLASPALELLGVAWVATGIRAAALGLAGIL